MRYFPWFINSLINYFIKNVTNSLLGLITSSRRPEIKWMRISHKLICTQYLAGCLYYYWPYGQFIKIYVFNAFLLRTTLYFAELCLKRPRISRGLSVISKPMTNETALTILYFFALVFFKIWKYIDSIYIFAKKYYL